MNLPNLKAKGEALLICGDLPQVVADKLGVRLETAQLWKVNLKKEDTDVAVSELASVDVKSLDRVVELVKTEAPPAVAKKIEAVMEGVKGLQSLEPEFLKVVANLLAAAEDMTSQEMSVRDWVAISNGIGNLYSNIYNKTGTNVNVINQPQVHSEKLSMFKGSMRG